MDIGGPPSDCDVGTTRSHSTDVKLVGEFHRMFFLFHPVQLNLAGGDSFARLVAVHMLSQQLKKSEVSGSMRGKED